MSTQQEARDKSKKSKKCTEKCRECVICKGKVICCACDWNNGYHACVYWQRGSKDKK